MQETWKDIEGYEGYYQVSDRGRIKSLKRLEPCPKPFFRLRSERILKGRLRNEYISVSLSKEGAQKDKVIHRLMAMAFIPNPENKPQINHKNGIKTDNRIDNLEWCTPGENLHHSIRMGLSMGSMPNNFRSKRLNQYDLNGNFIREWPSTMETERNGYDSSHVSRCCTGKRITYRGYKWQYI